MPEDKIVNLPYNFLARPHQKKFLSVMNRKYRRAFLTWHRRGGKDLTAFNFLIKEAYKAVGLYIYVMPTWSQCKRNIWDAMTTDGTRFLDCIPPDLVKSKNESELQITFKNGSIIQLASAEKYNRLRGMNARGFLLSEYAFMHPKVLDVITPILLENGGFLAILTTPNGKNHAFKLWEAAKNAPDTWFTELLTIRDTTKLDGSPIISEADVRRIQTEEGKSDEDINREYFCSYDGSITGAYYEKLIIEAEEQGRIGSFSWNPKLPVHTAWDIGVNDASAIWFYQYVDQDIIFIDHYENTGEGVEHYVNYVNKKPYMYKVHNVPHDFKNRVFANGAKSAHTTAVALQGGLDNFKVIPSPKPKIRGIQEVRSVLPRCRFNKELTKYGIDALREYHARYDEKNDTSSISPVHDWASNTADAFQTFALSVPNKKRQKSQDEIDNELNVLNKLFHGKIDNWAKNNRQGWMRN